MKLFKKVLLPLLLSSALMLSACSTSSGTEKATTQASTSDTTISEVQSMETTTAVPISETSSAEEIVTEETVPTSTGIATTTAQITTTTAASTTTHKTTTEKLYVHFLDIGQGDSIFIELPNGQSMLIDAAEDEQADKIITYIHQQGYDSLDYVVATHPHDDHIGGMDNVINNFNVSNVYLSPATHTTKSYENMITAISSSGAKSYTAMAGDTILSDGDLLIEVVAPKTTEYDDLNNASVVIKLTYDNNKFLFTGDAEKEEEDGIWTNIKCDVLKVGHHGSDSSTTANFIKKVEPTYAVISCGLGNSYGHPTDTILKRLADNNIKTFRTDTQGTIVFTSDGTTISVDKSPSEYNTPAETTITTTQQATVTTSDGTYKYVLNTNTKKIHYADCKSVNKIKDENKAYTNDYDQAIADGYTPCGNCHPVG